MRRFVCGPCPGQAAGIITSGRDGDAHNDVVRSQAVSPMQQPRHSWFLTNVLLLAPAVVAFAPARAAADMLTLTFPAADSNEYATGSGAAGDEFGRGTDPQRDTGQRQLESPALPPWGSASFGLCPNGMGSQPSPDGPGGGGLSQVPATTSRPAAEALARAGVLLLESASRRPPPFPSRLFRPPRLSGMLV